MEAKDILLGTNTPMVDIDIIEEGKNTSVEVDSALAAITGDSDAVIHMVEAEDIEVAAITNKHHLLDFHYFITKK